MAYFYESWHTGLEQDYRKTSKLTYSAITETLKVQQKRYMRSTYDKSILDSDHYVKNAFRTIRGHSREKGKAQKFWQIFGVSE